MKIFDLTETIRFYEHALERVLPPSCLIATAAKAADFDSDLRPNDRNLMHPHWLVRTANPALVPNADRAVSFEQSLSFILDRTPDTDYLCALRRRFFCAEILSGTGVQRRASPRQALRRLEGVDQLLRWCNANSIFSFGQLTPQHFEQFDEDSSSGDVTDLLPVTSWLEQLLEEPHFVLPKYRHGYKLRLHWAEIASSLGVTARALAKSRAFQAAFNARLPLFLEKEGIQPEKVVVRLSDIQFKENTGGSYRQLLGWDTLDRLSVKGVLGVDSLAFRQSIPHPRIDDHGRRTTTLYPHDMHRLLTAAAKWVLVFGPLLLQALEKRAQSTGSESRYGERIDSLHSEVDDNWPTAFPKLSLAVGSRFDAGKRIPLSNAVSLLFTACAIVIGIFSARRRGEVEALRTKCLYQGPTGLMFSIYIEKTLQAVDGVPVPEIVRNVIEILDRLSYHSRSEMNDDFLFAFKSNFDDGKKLRADVRFAAQLIEFTTVAGVAPPAGQRVWRLNYHMFRKGFVVSFYHGNLWRSFDATSWMLRHRSGDMTGIYMDDDDKGEILWLRSEVKRLTDKAIEELTDSQREYLRNAKAALKDRKELSNLWNEGRQEFFVSTMMDIYDGVERPIGRGAARLLEALNEMENVAYSRIRLSAVPTNAEVGVRTDVFGQVSEFVATHFMEPVPGMPLYCTFKRGSSEDAALANCLQVSSPPLKRDGQDITRDPRKPNYAFSGAYPCLGCPLVAMLNDNQKEITSKVEEMQAEVARAPSQATASGAQKMVDDIMKFLTDAREAVDGKQRIH